jgi:hypothetical protein
MNDLRFTFEEHGTWVRSVYRFYDDRIERDWDAVLRKGNEIYPVSSISGRITEQTTFAYGIRGPLKSFVLYLLVALVLHLGFSQPVLNGVAFIFYGLAVLSAGFALSKLKKEKWLYVKSNNGGTLFGIREKGLKGATVADFVREIGIYAKVANQLPDPTSPSVTPPAGAGGAPSVAADH